MDEKSVRLVVPAEAAFARTVRMSASALAVCCDMSVDAVEDVRMVAEEGFVYCCATAPEAVDVSFSLSQGGMTMDFSLGSQVPEGEGLDLVEVLLAAACDEFCVSEDGRTLHLVMSSQERRDD